LIVAAFTFTADSEHCDDPSDIVYSLSATAPSFVAFDPLTRTLTWDTSSSGDIGDHIIDVIGVLATGAVTDNTDTTSFVLTVTPALVVCSESTETITLGVTAPAD
jgi:hypothetical protein